MQPKTKFIGKARITKQGQVTLPLEARKDLALPEHAEIFWYLVDDHLIVTRDLLSIHELEKKLRRK